MAEKCAGCDEDFQTAIGYKWNPETGQKEEVEYISEPVYQDGDDKYHMKCIPS